MKYNRKLSKKKGREARQHEIRPRRYSKKGRGWKTKRYWEVVKKKPI
jgi:hypothetical protein